MRKRKKQAGRKAKKRTELLAALVTGALLYTAMPAYASIVVTDTDSSTINYSKASESQTVGSGEVWRTYTGASQTAQSSTTYTGNIVVQSGGIWRPMDAASTIYLNGTLELYSGAILDLSYKYGDNYGSYEGSSVNVRQFRTSSSLKNATIFHDGAILRLNLKGSASGSKYYDRVFFYNPQLATGDTSATVIVQFRLCKYLGGINWDASTANYYSGSYANVINLYNLTDDVASNLNFVAESYYVDSSLSKYLFVPTLTTNYTSGTTKTYALSWTATRTELISQGVFSAANAQLSMRNLWRMEDGLFWKRGEDLRAASRLGRSGGADGAWAQVWRGDYSFAGAYGSDFGQSYNGIQVGYDKEREGEIFGGKLYTGVFLSLLRSDADFHQHSIKSGTDEAMYSSSVGDLKSGGLGLYTSWIGDKGHYLDLTVRGSKLSNKYKYYDSDDVLYDNDYSTWVYGAGVRYGYQKQLPNGWYLEPQVGLSYGTMQGYTFTQANNMRYNQDRMEMLIGRLGVTAGRNFGGGDRRGTVYAKAAVNHDFKDGGSARADALYLSGSNYLVGSSMAIDTLASKDTWYEFALGANLQTGKDRTAFIELMKTAGGKVNTDWQINAGMSWRFGGPSSTEHAAAPTAAFDRSISALTTPPVAGTSAVSPAAITPVGTDVAAGASRQETQTGTEVQANKEVQADQATQSAKKVQAGQESQTAQPEKPAPTEQQLAQAGSVGDSERNAGFVLPTLVVEAARPDWEKKLSPGTVSVIRVSEYKGEMKNLPDLLQTVPGVYVQRLQGTSHYTVARVRGATGGEVNIYVDGVLINSASEAAVDLSTIPVENVDHIEVYRGYVPVRFAGSPIGGAINIVTKKPQDTKGSISTGIRSFGGYTSNLELTAPVGSGSLLFALNRDQADGDFRYDHLRLGYTDTRYRKNNEYKNTDALLKWQDDNWFAKLTYKKNEVGFPDSTSLYYADWQNYPLKKQDTTKTELLLGRRQTAGNLEWGWKLDTSYQDKKARAMVTKSTLSGYTAATADFEFRNRRYEGSVDGSWKLGKNHLVEFLFDYSRETMNTSYRGLQVWPVGTTGVTSVLSNYKQYFKTNYLTTNYYFQVQDTMTLNKSGNLFFTPVVRAQRMTMDVNLGDPDIGAWKYSYGLGLKKVQNEHWTFRGTYGTYYKFPNFYELFGDGVNVQSRWETYKTGYTDFLLDSYVERGTSWDVGANWQGRAFKADADVTLTYFHRDAKNLSTYSIDPYGVGYYSNLAAGKIRGIELESKLNWQRWNLLLAATWNDSLVTQSGAKASLVTESQTQAGHPFPWVPEWEANARLSYRFPGEKLTVFGEYHYLGKTGVYYDDYSVLYDALGLVNVGLKYDFSSKVKLTAGVNDLFNKGPDQLWRAYKLIEDPGNVQYPLQGRTYYITMQYLF